MDVSDLTPWQFLPIGYALSVVVETAVLAVGLSPQHSWRTKITSGLWLTACTYPIVILVLPPILGDRRGAYLAVAETFAPFAECVLFRLAFGGRAISDADARPNVTWRDYAAVVVANLASFGVGEWLFAT